MHDINTPATIAFIPVIEWPKVLEPPAVIDHGFVRVSLVPTEALPALVAQHLEPLKEQQEPIESTCPLFGGLVLEIDGRRLLYPQCCGHISEIATWMTVLDSGFRSGVVACMGHPCPEVFRCGDQIEIVCQDEWEAFRPPAETSITMSVRDFGRALERANQEVHAFAQRIAACDGVEGAPEIAGLLVFGEAGAVTAA